MNPDDLKAAWRTQTSQTRLTVDADLLLKEVRRNQKSFSAMIFWRDVREVGVCLLLVPVWFYLGAKHGLPWTWYLMVPGLFWVAGFMLVDRMRHSHRPPAPGEPLRARIEDSLRQLEHQIWLLRNVVWWYLLAPALSMLAFFGQVTWLSRDLGWISVLVGIGMVAVAFITLSGVYWLNQRAVRSELEPRRQELQAMLASLQDSADAGSPTPAQAVPSAQPNKTRNPMKILGIVLLFALTAAVSAWAYRAGQPARVAFNPAFCPTGGDPVITNLLVPIRQKHQVPALAAALVTSKGLASAGVVGTRKNGTELAAGLNDQWHLGSDGKAMTATLVARLVEQGCLRWDSTLAEIFPDLAAGFDPDARKITLLHLLTHRSGLKPNPDLIAYGGTNGPQERLRLVKDELRKAPNCKPGTHYEYSNLGYSIVGAVTEKITGKSWEQAMQDEVFGPLGMSSVGYGGTGTPGLVDQPWGHGADGQPVADNGPQMDNPPVLSPAGRVHCTIQDWARFIADQLRGARGEPALLQAASYQKLQSPSLGGEYALGWLVVEREWGGGKVLNHGGDNTMNFANVWVAPRRDFAVLVCLNQSGETAFKASDEAVGALIEWHAQQAGFGGGERTHSGARETKK